MKKSAIKDSLLRSTALTVGGAGSRIVADKLPVANNHLKRGGMVLLGVIGAAFVDRKTPSKAFVQDIALGTAATQAGYWIKDAIGTKTQNPLIKTALGTPGDYNNPVQFRMGYANVPNVIDTTYEEVSDVQFSL